MSLESLRQREEESFCCLHKAEPFICRGCREAALRDDIKQDIAENTFNKENHC